MQICNASNPFPLCWLNNDNQICCNLINIFSSQSFTWWIGHICSRFYEFISLSGFHYLDLACGWPCIYIFLKLVALSRTYSYYTVKMDILAIFLYVFYRQRGFLKLLADIVVAVGPTRHGWSMMPTIFQSGSMRVELGRTIPNHVKRSIILYKKNLPKIIYSKSWNNN